MDCNRYFYFYIFIICLTSTCVTGSRYTKHYPTNLTELAHPDFQDFLNSFDVVITDIDGAIRNYKSEPYEIFSVLQKLNGLGKKNILISSNSYFPAKSFSSLVDAMGYKADSDEIVLPSDALIWYLKKNNFTAKAYVIGCDLFRKSLIESGLNIVASPKVVKENVYDMSHLFDTDGDVKAVIVDLDANVNWIKLNLAGLYLKDPKVAFLAGMSERMFPAFRDDRSMGPSYFLNLLINYSKRKPLLFSKPGTIFGDFIVERYSLSNSSRVLLIGDTIDVDMKFANMYNFQKLQIGPGLYLSKPAKCMKGAPPVANYFIDDLNDMMKLF